MPGVYRLRATYPPRRKLRVQLYPVAVDGTGSGSATFSIAAAAGGAADVAGTGAATVTFAAAAGGAADFTGSGSASFSFSAAGVDGDAASVTTRLTLTGTSQQRYVIAGQSAERYVIIGASQP